MAMELSTNATPASATASNTSATNIRLSEPEGRDEEEGNIINIPRDQDDWTKEMRGWLMVLAVLAASVTYQAGLNPPGGVWQDDLQSSNSTQGHTAGNPVLATKSPVRYAIFFSFNGSAFLMSLMIIVLLLKPSFFHEELRLDLLRYYLIGNNISLVVAFLVGSCNDFKSARGLLVMIVVLLIWHLICMLRIKKRSHL